ncbi:MAG: hypothetical protein ACREA7_04825, partial [Nitrosotalea sp.]
DQHRRDTIRRRVGPLRYRVLELQSRDKRTICHTRQGRREERNLLGPDGPGDYLGGAKLDGKHQQST